MATRRLSHEEKANEIVSQRAVVSLPRFRTTRDQAESIERMTRNGEAYAMPHGVRGRAIIVANTEFTGNSALPGVNVDIQNLQNIFRHLKFRTSVWKNLRRSDLIAHLERENKRPEHQDADAFVLCVSSHGSRDVMLASDNKPLCIDELTNYFDGVKCEALVGKPKLFIIDTCQGEKETQGVEAPGIVAKDAGRPSPEPMRYHEKADMSIFYPTVPDFKTYDNKETGSPFIRTLTYVLSQKAHCSDWTRMTTEVTAIMPYMTRHCRGNLLAPRVVTTFSKQLYLLPRQKIQISASVDGARMFHVEVYDDDTIDAVCGRISAESDLTAAEIQLSFGDNNNLDRRKTVGDYGIRANSRLTVIMLLRGGGRGTSLQISDLIAAAR